MGDTENKAEVGAPVEKMEVQTVKPPADGPKLDRDSFKTAVKMQSLKIACKDTTKTVKDKVISTYLLKIRGQRTVIPDPDNPKEFRRVLLDPEKIAPDVKFQNWPRDIYWLIRKNEEFKIIGCQYTLERSYNECSVQDVLSKVLPKGVEVPLSFETVGHIAHFNLREAHEPYKYIIGQVVLDKNRGLKTVVTKTHELDSENEFRVFPMEVIAGEDNTLTTVKEQGLTFELDYRDVYWNSRLSQERQRVKGLIGVKTRVLDMFAGAGAMSSFLAHQGSTVYSNDLNPKGSKWMEVNRKRNHVEGNMTVFNLDAREFVINMQKEKNVFEITDDVKTVHCIMNLPALALDFLDCFKGVCKDVPADTKLCTVKIHCYCFARASPPDSEIHPRVETALGCVPEGLTNHLVRDVAPNKKMYCVEFVVPETILRDTNTEKQPDTPLKEQEAKRQRVD